MIGHLTSRIVVSVNTDQSGTLCVGLFNPDATDGSGETLGAALDRIDAFEKIGLVLESGA